MRFFTSEAPIVLETQTPTPFTPEQLLALDPQKIPKHVAIIPDGNRRWAKQHWKLPKQGHRMGAEAILQVIEAALQIGVKVLTFFIFSTENWNRPKHEIKAQMWLLEKYLEEQREKMLRDGVRFRTIGEIARLPSSSIAQIQQTIEATALCNKMDVVFAMNYGGRDDLVRAVRKIVCACESGALDTQALNEACISRHLDTAEWPDPELLIRTSGESRLSNFLLWQLSYSELHLTPRLWPEFTPQDFLEAICAFQQRQRRMGGGS